jgi:hypothetical protein
MIKKQNLCTNGDLNHGYWLQTHIQNIHVFVFYTLYILKHNIDTLTMVVGSKYIYTHLTNRTHMFLCFIYSSII